MKAYFDAAALVKHLDGSPCVRAVIKIGESVILEDGRVAEVHAVVTTDPKEFAHPDNKNKIVLPALVDFEIK